MSLRRKRTQTPQNFRWHRPRRLPPRESRASTNRVSRRVGPLRHRLRPQMKTIGSKMRRKSRPPFPPGGKNKPRVKQPRLSRGSEIERARKLRFRNARRLSLTRSVPPLPRKSPRNRRLSPSGFPIRFLSLEEKAECPQGEP